MIKVKMNGRLGNQMFQYAFARHLQEKNGQDLFFDFSEVVKNNGQNGWEDSLKYFQVKKYETYKRKFLPFIFWRQNLHNCLKIFRYYRYYKKANGDIYQTYLKQIEKINEMDELGILWLSNGYYDFNSHNDELLLNGAFEDPRFFDDIKHSLMKEFTPKKRPSEENEKLLRKIKNCESVCVSIRSFSEILEENEKFSLYDVIDKGYYKNAISRMQEMYPDAIFFIFSDNLDWVKVNIDLEGYDCIFEPLDNPIWEKLRLMYTCKHFIISNSTFSWWAQYLSRNSEKKVISPSKWFNSPFQPGLIDKEWIKM